MSDTVVVSDLVKRYVPSMPAAVDGLGFAVGPGEVFGLLGPNGAGKTTTVGILTTRVTATSGRAEVDGVDVVADPVGARKVLAVVPQRNNLDRALDVRQNLVYHAAYHGMGRADRRARADDLLATMGLSDHAGAQVDTLSGGQAQRVLIARALMHRPRVLFLDEPSTGLDPQSRRFVHEQVAALRADGVTVVVTTHDMDEAALLCDRVGIVDHGKLLALDTPEAMCRTLPGSTTLTLTVRTGAQDPDTVVAALTDLDNVERVERIAAAAPPPMFPGFPMPPPDGGGDPDAVQLRIYSGCATGEVLPILLKVLGDLDCEVSDLSVGTPSLEDVFIHLTGRELR